MVEGDADVAELVRAVLVRAEFDVVLARTGDDGLRAVRAHEPVLTVVAASCGGSGGREVARAVREFSSTRILVLADSVEQVERGELDDLAADAVVAKPVRPRSLRTSVEEAMRQPLHQPSVAHNGLGHAGRGDHPWGHAGEPEGSTLVHPSERPHAVPTAEPARVDDSEAWARSHGLAIDVDARSVEVDGRPVDLSRTEFDLLAALVSTGRRVRSKADLVLTLRGQSYVATYFVSEADKRAVEVHLANIRRKLGDVGPRPRWIETVRGVGYRMAQG